jgi:ABC-2 type transport system ATP-binding protein
VSAVISASNLSRFYGDVVGLADLTVEIEPGITGLVGPNGAGKSTFLKLLVGELKPSRGKILALGHEPFANRALYRELGFCPQQDALYDTMSGRKMLQIFLRLSGYDRREADRRGVRALERVQLTDAMERRLGGYSKGMRQRARIALAIAHDPRIVVLDEPLNGLDPVSRHHVLELFRELGANGVHVLLSSHVLHEVESLTQTIVLLHRGRLLAQGGVGEVRRLLSRHPRQVRVRARSPRPLAEACMRLEHVLSARLEPAQGELVIETHDIEAFERALPTLVRTLQPGVSSLESTDASLEAVFDYLVE